MSALAPDPPPDILPDQARNATSDPASNSAPNLSSDPSSDPASDPASDPPPDPESDSESDGEIHSCENLTNRIVYQFLLSRTTKDTSDELISYERCPHGLKPDHFKNFLANFKKEYQRLQKSRHKSEESDHEFVAFTQSLFVYPQTSYKTYKKRKGAEKNHASDEDTFAKVAWELGGELNEKKKEIAEMEIRNKRTIDQLMECVDEAKQENKSLSDELGEKNESYKR